jgi:hypothetical protein
VFFEKNWNFLVNIYVVAANVDDGNGLPANCTDDQSIVLFFCLNVVFLNFLNNIFLKFDTLLGGPDSCLVPRHACGVKKRVKKATFILLSIFRQPSIIINTVKKEIGNQHIDLNTSILVLENIYRCCAYSSYMMIKKNDHPNT